jgi:hypothetical protein
MTTQLDHRANVIDLKSQKDRCLMNVQYWCKKNINHRVKPDIKIKYVGGVYEIHGHDIELVTREVRLPFRIIPRNSLLIKAKFLNSFDNICYHDYKGDMAHSATVRYPHINFVGVSQLNPKDLITNHVMDFCFTNSQTVNPQSLIHLAFDNLYFKNSKSSHIHDLSNFAELNAYNVSLEPLMQISNFASILLSHATIFSFTKIHPKSFYTVDDLYALNGIIGKYFNQANKRELLMDMTLELSDKGFDSLI